MTVYKIRKEVKLNSSYNTDLCLQVKPLAQKTLALKSKCIISHHWCFKQPQTLWKRGNVGCCYNWEGPVVFPCGYILAESFPPPLHNETNNPILHRRPKFLWTPKPVNFIRNTDIQLSDRTWPPEVMSASCKFSKTFRLCCPVGINHWFSGDLVNFARSLRLHGKMSCVVL